MTRSRKRLFASAKAKKNAKKIGITLAILVIVGLVVFAEIIRPNQDAKAYHGRLEVASQPLNDCFKKLGDTTQQDIFYAPDIDLKLKISNVNAIRTQVTACRGQIDEFNKTVQSLLSFKLAGYTSTYRSAQLDQRHAVEMISQSEDVMNQYDEVAAFLQQYYGHLATFLAALDSLNKAEDSNTLSNDNGYLTQQAASLRAQATAMRALDPPLGFKPSRDTAATMIDNMATGFESLGKGYDTYSDSLKSLGYKQIDDAVGMYDNTVNGQPYPLLNNAYANKEVNALPAKIENLLAGASE